MTVVRLDENPAKQGYFACFHRFEVKCFVATSGNETHQKVRNLGQRTPVSALFQSQYGNVTQAVAQTPGHNVYFRPGGIFGSGGITPGDIIHEGLHNLTGLGDSALAQKLGATPGSGIAAINPALQAHDCF